MFENNWAKGYSIPAIGKNEAVPYGSMNLENPCLYNMLLNEKD